MIYYIGTILIVISGIPQIVRLEKRKSSKDISIWMYLMTLIGTGFLLAKTININDMVFIATETAIMTTLLITIIMIIAYRKYEN